MVHPAVPVLVFAAVEGGLILGATSTSSTPDDPLGWLSTLGPFSVAIGLSYYLLRRSDSREAEAEQHHLERERRLSAQLIECHAALAVARSEIDQLKGDP